jgi:GT2 family glycosyltransferase
MGRRDLGRTMTDAPITVIVPVYRGLDEVRACIESVLRHGASVPFDLLAIDDESPEPEVTAYLEQLSTRTREPTAGQITVLRNPRNRGFVTTVNRGLAMATGDVVILNADTVVTDGWLDRLREAAAGADVGTVTPVTNFGSICTVPDEVISAFDLDSTDPRIDECAAFVERNALGHRPSVITGVGFCMLMTRAALDACGPFDARTFGRGYGEEVDFCLRATRLGFRHLVEDRTFVYHHGGVSFGDERAEGLERGGALIRDRYPWFRPTLRQEMLRDPLGATFTALRLALHERDERRPHVLHVLHSAPDALGGTEKHLAALIEALLPDFDFSVLYPTRSAFVLRTSWRMSDGSIVHDEHLLPGGARRVTRIEDENAAAALQTALDMFHFDAVHVQNLIGHSLSPLAVLESFPGEVVCSVRDPFL